MNRLFLLRPLSAEELLALQRLLRAGNTRVSLYRRCNLIWQLVVGYSIAEASEIARVHYTHAHKWVKRFFFKGLAGLQDRSRSRQPRVYSEKAETLVVKTATSRPQDLQLGFATWSLVKLEKHFRQFLRLESISRETIRHILSRHGLRLLTGQT